MDFVQSSADSSKMADVPIFRRKNSYVRFLCLVVYRSSR